MYTLEFAEEQLFGLHFLSLSAFQPLSFSTSQLFNLSACQFLSRSVCKSVGLSPPVLLWIPPRDGSLAPNFLLNFVSMFLVHFPLRAFYLRLSPRSIRTFSNARAVACA